MNATDLRRGTIIDIDGDPCVVTDFQHITPGKGQALMQTKIKNLKTGTTTQRRFRSTDKIDEIYLDTKVMEYLYQDGSSFVFMDIETYDQVSLGEEVAGEAMPYVPPNLRVKITFHEGKPMSIDLPAAVVLEITETDPGEKGNTVTNVFKPATLETGLVVKVPLFVSQGQKIKVDTRTGEFMERAN